MLAERVRLNLALVLLSTATIATAVHVARPRCERASPEVVTSLGSERDACPPHVRAAIHVGADATVSCVRGQFPEPGTFVFAQYTTTETWERFAVVADDGHLIVPMLDRPGKNFRK